MFPECKYDRKTSRLPVSPTPVWGLATYFILAMQTADSNNLVITPSKLVPQITLY